MERQEASRSEIRHLVTRFFKDSHELLVLNILEDRGIDTNEIRRLRQLLQQREASEVATSEVTENENIDKAGGAK
jgi:predicted transcriptional regulator